MEFRTGTKRAFSQSAWSGSYDDPLYVCDLDIDECGWTPPDELTNYPTSAPEPYTPVYLSNADGGCTKQIKNLGTSFATPNECADAAIADVNCIGDEIMWSDRYNYNWGCRCCAPGSEYGGYNTHWAVYRYDENEAVTPTPTVAEKYCCTANVALSNAFEVCQQVMVDYDSESDREKRCLNVKQNACKWERCSDVGYCVDAPDDAFFDDVIWHKNVGEEENEWTETCVSCTC